MAARDAGAGSVVWVGDLGARVTQEALRDAFRQACAPSAGGPSLGRALTASPAQFGDVAEARLVRDGFSARATGCGWVRFRDAESAADVVQRCNVTALYIIGAPPPGRRGSAATPLTRPRSRLAAAGAAGQVAGGRHARLLGGACVRALW